MKVLLLITLISAIAVSLHAYEIPDENEYVTETYRMKVTATIIPDPEMKKSTGRATVTVALTDGEGNPQPDRQLKIQANAGTFLCKLPEDSTTPEPTSPNDCFKTSYDGNANLYLVNIPINTPIRINASYSSGEQNVSGYATLSISHTRSVRKSKGKKRVIPRVR